MKPFSMIVALGPDLALGYQNGLPWKLKQDLQYFKQVTSNNSVIMGRKTFESIGSKPLPNRQNIVVSRSLAPSKVEGANVTIQPSLEQAVQFASQSNKDVFVIGGKNLYEEAANHELCNQVYLTRVGRKFKADTYLEKGVFDGFRVLQTSRTHSENDINFDFQRLVKGDLPSIVPPETHQHEEFQYLDMIRDIIARGTHKTDRTGVGTISTFGNTMRFSLEHSFPLLTTKKVFFRGVVEELLWFLRGQTNGNVLLEKNVKIWEGNGSREYLDSIGLKHREAKCSDLGPVYGFQWKHFGAQYETMHQDYSGQGVDQIKTIIDQLKNNPDSRRMILSAWNPSDLSKMALPPCHVLSQFYVSDGKLSCMMYQRSCDFGLGVPFNIASYALLTCILANHCGLQRGDFVHVLGDTHIYSNHVEQLKQQIQRVPFPFPLLRIKSNPAEIEQHKYEDFELIGYQNHEKIQMKMAV